MPSPHQVLPAQIQQTLEQPDARNVHDLRVAIRRFNQAIRLSPPTPESETLRTRLKTTMRLAGDVRNTDITLKLVSKLKDGTKPLQERLHSRRSRAMNRLVKHLAKVGHVAVSKEVRPESRGNQQLLSSLRRFFKRARKIDDPLQLHRVRIAAKKLRYTLELVAPGHPKIEQIRRIQTQLGEINDFETACSIIKEERGAKAVRDSLKRRQAKRIRDFQSAWMTLGDPETARQWVRELTHPSPRSVSRPRTTLRSS